MFQISLKLSIELRKQETGMKETMVEGVIGSFIIIPVVCRFELLRAPSFLHIQSEYVFKEKKLAKFSLHFSVLALVLCGAWLGPMLLVPGDTTLRLIQNIFHFYLLLEWVFVTSNPRNFKGSIVGGFTCTVVI